jgi:hypothetical protein
MDDAIHETEKGMIDAAVPREMQEASATIVDMIGQQQSCMAAPTSFSGHK